MPNSRVYSSPFKRTKRLACRVTVPTTIITKYQVGLIPPALPKALLFLLFGFGIPGVFGLLSPLLPFRAPTSATFVSTTTFSGVGGAVDFA